MAPGTFCTIRTIQMMTLSPYTILKKKALSWIALFLLLCPLALGGWLALYSLQPGPVQEAKDAIVLIPPGSGLKQIGTILAEAGLIDEDIRFLVLAKYLGLSRKLPAGEFRLSLGKRPGDVLRQLAAAKPVRYAVTIPEGLRIEEVADIFAADGWCDREPFIALAHDPEFIVSLGITSGRSLEGYLYPDTYYLTREQRDAKTLITMQVNRFHKVWSGLGSDPEHPLSRHEVVTLASVVEKETGAAEERPVIAAVFLNRLKTRMRLQSDPTVIYGLKNFSGNLTRADLMTEHPYNTYVIPSLPIGPICNPGQKAMEAVLRPAATDFFYFVSKNDGTHQFSKNLAEHNQAVQQYQRRKKTPEK
ncbi:MAG: endolytic transglycosylase MltG [Desulfoarculaceae bacterium]|nr:endolytic transglycosylase MltG [Desulfoarculaceae bacterium]